LTEFADFDCFRHQLVQAFKELIQLGFVGNDIFDKRCWINQRVGQRAGIAVFILYCLIERDLVSGATEFTGQTVGVTEPELVFRTGALSVGLLTFAVGVMEADVFTVDLFGYFHPFTGSYFLRVKC